MKYPHLYLSSITFTHHMYTQLLHCAILHMCLSYNFLHAPLPSSATVMGEWASTLSPTPKRLGLMCVVVSCQRD